MTESNQTVQSIGPAIRVLDKDENIFIRNLRLSIDNPEGTRPYIDCLGQCQNQRLASVGLLNGAINLLERATFNEGSLGFSRRQIGSGGCDAVRFQRTSSPSEDGFGRIPRSELPSDFVSGEFTVSLVLNITNEGHALIIVNTNDSTASINFNDRYFGLWIRRTSIRFNYLYGNNEVDSRLFSLSGPPVSLLFDPDTGTYETRHFVFVYRTTPSNRVDVYINCELIGSQTLNGALIAPPTNPSSDVFIGHSRPSTLSTPGSGHLGGDIHGLYYFHSALTVEQIGSYCSCGRERLHVPSTVPSSITVTDQQDHLISLQAANPSTTESIPVDDLQNFLRSVGYENTYRPPTLQQQKTLSFLVTDDIAGTSDTDGSVAFVDKDTNIPVVDLNGLAVSGINYTTSFTEDMNPVTITDAGVSITRANDANVLPTFTSVTVQLVNSVDNGEYLMGTSGDNIKVSGSQTSLLTISGPGLGGEFNAVLKSIRYNNENDKPSNAFPRQITFVVTDTEGRVNSPLATAFITVIPTNDAPQLALSTVNGDSVHTVTFQENGAPVLLAPNTTVNDVDSDLLQSAEVKITTNFQTQEDKLEVTATPNITASYNTATGVLTLTGAASLADYENTLRSVQFSSTANPLLDSDGQPESVLEREVEMVISDGDLTSQTVTVAVNFIPLDNPPIIRLNGSSTLIFTDEDSPLKVFPNAYIEDSDNTRLRSLRVTLQDGADGDLLDDGRTRSRILSYTMDNTENTVVHFTSILRNISYVNNAAEPTLTPRTVIAEVSDFSVNDGDNVNNTVVVIDIRDLNDNSPTFNQNSYQFTVNENTPSGTSIGTITASDADRDPTTISFTLLTNSQEFSLSPSSGPSPISVNVLTSEMFDFESSPNVFDVIVQASDGQLSSNATIEVTVIDINEPPVVSPSTTTILAAADRSRPIVQTTFTITDVDSADKVTSGRFTLSDVPAGSDERLAPNQTLPGYNFTETTPGVYLLTNTGSPLTFAEAMQYVFYVAGTDVEDSSKLRTISWVVFDSSSLPSAPATILVSLADIPEFLNADQYTATLVEGQSYNNFLQVTATVQSGGDVIVYSVQDNFGVSINANNGSLTLFEPLNFEKTGPTVMFEVYAVDTLPPARTGTATVTITVVDSNDVPPMLNTSSGEILVQPNVPGVLVGDVVITDPDNFDLVGATITINGAPLPASPFSGTVCEDERNIITKYASTCSISNFTRLINSATNHSEVFVETDMYDNSILTNTGSGYALVSEDFADFRGTISQFTLAFWLQPTPGQSGYVVFFSNTAGTERYLAVYLDGDDSQLIVTLKQTGVPGLLGQVRVIFQLPDSMTSDGQYHFIMLRYWNRMLSCSADGSTIPSMAVTYKNLIGQVFSEC